MKICNAPGCVRKHYSLGYCHMHYKRLYKTGKLTINGSFEPVKRAKGKGTIDHGYHRIKNNGIRQYVHIAIVEDILGHKLPKGAHVHHVDANSANNEHSNLVVCPNQDYHLLLHRRQRAMDTCGNPDYRKCLKCKTWDHPNNMREYKRKDGTTAYYKHESCDND